MANTYNFLKQDDIVFYLLLELYYSYRTNQSGCSTKEIYEILAKKFELSKDELNLVYKSDGSSKFEADIRFAKQELKDQGCLSIPQRGYYIITPKGIETIESMKIV